MDNRDNLFNANHFFKKKRITKERFFYFCVITVESDKL